MQLPITNDVTGSIVPDGRIDVASRVTGFIRQLDVREGQAVKRGDLLVRIDASDIDAAIVQARAGVQAAREAWQRSRPGTRFQCALTRCAMGASMDGSGAWCRRAMA